jgi:rhodanese-related sulfurtransferase
VRPKFEYDKLSVVGALSFPMATFEQRAPKLDKETEFYVHCDKVGCDLVLLSYLQTSHEEPEGTAVPTDSLRAAEMLVKLGFKDVSVIEGTAEDLKKAGFFYKTANSETVHPPPIA